MKTRKAFDCMCGKELNQEVDNLLSRNQTLEKLTKELVEALNLHHKVIPHVSLACAICDLLKRAKAERGE